MECFALGWIPSRRYIGSINCSNGRLQDQGRSTVAKVLAANRTLDGIAQTRFGGFFYVSLKVPPACVCILTGAADGYATSARRCT